MQFKGVGVTLTGKKSWFMFDDEVVCLGAGITSTDNRPIETTVENRKLGPTGSNAFTVNGVTKPNVSGWSEAMNGVNWAHLSGTASAADIGYYFPQSATLTAVREARTGAWADVDAGSSTAPITRNYLRMGFEHGGNPGNATYQYVLLPGRTAKRVGHYAAQPQITILNNNANVQAVRENTLGITAANFWTDNTFTYGGITSNRKASVMVRDDGTFIDVAVSDPTQANTGSIDIQLASSATALVSADSGITVTQTNPGIHMTVNVNGARGKTFRARFFIGTAETVNLEPVADTYGHDAAASVDTNYGTENRVIVKKANTGFNRESYLRFDVPAWNGIMLGASLRLMPIHLAVPGVNGVSVVSDNTWIESGAGGLTWNNRPASSATLLSTWTPELDVPVNADVSAAITNSGLVSFHLRAITETSNGIVFYGSRENTTAANRPQLALTLGHTPPEVSLISPSDGDVLTNGGTVTITADAVPTVGAVTGVAFYNGATLLGTDTTAPYSITTTLPGGLHSLTAVATDSNSLTKTSLAHEIEIAFPPNAAAGNLDTLRNVPVDVDLRTLASDVETPDAGLRFTLGAASNGSVTLLADGYTARFSPAADYSGPAGFDYTVTDATSDDRTVFNYDFQASDATDVSGRGRDGTIHLQGTGTATFTADLPTALTPHHTQSLRLTENGTAGAARVERVMAAEDLNVATDNWTITGWFNRATTTNMDVILQIGQSGGFNPNALTLAFYTTSNTLELRNYNINTLDIGISQTNVPAGQWHHYAITRDGGTLSLYLNGVLVGSDSSFGFSFTPATAIKFGALSNTVVLDRWFNGSLADPAIFKGALNAVDIAKLGTLPTAYFAGLTATNTVNVEVTAPPFVPTAITWEGGSAETDWSTNDNWSDNVAPNGNDITFNITAASASGVTNTVDSSIPIASLSYRFEDAALQHTTAIAAGRTWTVTGNFLLSDGTSAVTTMNLVNNAFGHSAAHSATVDFAGHPVDGRISTLNMARRHHASANGGATATLTFDTGTLEVATANMARNGTGPSTATTHATIHIGGGTANFGTINMAESTAAPGATTNATLNLTGGVTTVTGNIVRIGGSGTTHAIVNLNGGVLDMANGNIGDAANPVTLILASGTLQNVAQINGGADFVKTGTGTLILSGNNSHTGNTVVEEGILSVSSPGFADASTVSIGTLANPGAAFLNLPNPGDDTVAALCINGVGQPAGRTYGNASSVLPVIATAAITGPGTITVPGSGTPYSLWADSFFPGNDVSDPDGDNDNDGLTNQQEFAFGLSPVDGSSVNPILVQLDKTTGTFTYQRRAGTGLTYRILTSTDLLAWPEDETAAQVPGPVDGNGNETVVVTLTDAPLTATNFFVRVAAYGVAGSTGNGLNSSANQAFFDNVRLDVETAPVATPTPNIVFFFLDDMRWDAAGFAGNSVITTPNMDTLASQGTVFENAFATTAICMVSRASVFMGQHMARHGITAFNQNLSAAKWADSYPDRLDDAGYYMGFIGKQGLGNGFTGLYGTYDFDKGYDSQGSYFNQTIDGEPANGRHLTKFMGDLALEFIGDAADPSKNPTSAPFCLQVSWKAPHVQDGSSDPFQNDPAFDSLYAADTIIHAKTDTQAQFDGNLSIFQSGEGTTRWTNRFGTEQKFQDNIRKHHRLIHGVDVQIGRILAALDDPNNDGNSSDSVAANTIIILSSDNGFFLGERQQAGKWYIHEESIRIPMVVMDPRLPAAQKGKRVSQMALTIDIPATILDYAGVTQPSVMQGRSMKPIIEGNPPGDWRTAFLHDHPAVGGGVFRNEGVRTGSFSYSRYPGNGNVKQLYDVETVGCWM